MANTYRYKKNIWILEDPVAYRREVQKVLDLILTTYSGRLLLRYINLSPQLLLIMPYVPSQERNLVNAYADPDDWNDAFTKGALRMIPLEIKGYGTLMMPEGHFGTGAGTGAVVKYHPAMWQQMARNLGYIAPGFGAGEVLFHEMLHAMRMMHGKFLRTAVTEDAHMDDFEEFCAILAANMYRSERGFHLMRLNHWGSEALSKDLSEPVHYAQFFQKEIEKWFASQRTFCLELAQSPASFNPMKYVAEDLGVPQVTPMAVAPAK